MLLPFIISSLPKSDTQHGFAPCYSYTSALLTIITSVVIDFNDAKPVCRSTMCAVNISKAFDAINHDLLMDQISSSSLILNLVRWLAAYICGRSAKCVYGSATSAPMVLRSGLPQGSVLSPGQFNFFVSGCPEFAALLTSYADDFMVLESDADLEALNRKLLASVSSITDWASRKKLSIAPAKSQVTLLTPWSKQYNTRPEVYIDGVDVPLCTTPKILGVTCDPMFCFHEHVTAIAAKATQRLNILKAVCCCCCC
jgi:hypothetical protein